MDEAPPALSLGGLTLRVHGRAGDGSDPWLDALARVSAPGAVVEVHGAWLRAEELAGLHQDLAAMHRDLRGTVALHCLEQVLRLNLACGRRGEVTMMVEITPDPSTQSHRFEFDVDQSHLPAALVALRAMLQKFPPPDRSAPLSRG